MAAEAQRAPLVRERISFAQRLRAFWRRIEPGFRIDRDNTTERWDCAGEGRATHVGFEGFGLSASFYIGRTPAFAPYKEGQRTDELRRWYAGEKL